MSRRNNPCKGRYAGCTANPPENRGMCDTCAARHAEKAAATREARKLRALCTVCGARAAIVGGGLTLTTCDTHREHDAARKRVA